MPPISIVGLDDQSGLYNLIHETTATATSVVQSQDIQDHYESPKVRQQQRFLLQVERVHALF